MARNVVDVRAGLLALAGLSAATPAPSRPSSPTSTPGERITIAVLADPPGGTTHPEIEASRPARRRHPVRRRPRRGRGRRRPATRRRSTTGRCCCSATSPCSDRSSMHGDVGADARSSSIALRGERTAADASSSRSHVQMERHRLMRDMVGVLRRPPGAAVAHLGTAGVRARRRPQRRARGGAPQHAPAGAPGQLPGLPAAVVPCGTAADLPVGVQVMGDRFTDLRCLAIAEQIQDAVGAPTPIDPVV